jgi:hypothetical protein
MRKVVESTFMTLDGEIQAPHKWGPPDRTLMAHGLVDEFGSFRSSPGAATGSSTTSS